MYQIFPIRYCSVANYLQVTNTATQRGLSGQNVQKSKQTIHIPEVREAYNLAFNIYCTMAAHQRR